MMSQSKQVKAEAVETAQETIMSSPVKSPLNNLESNSPSRPSPTKPKKALAKLSSSGAASATPAMDQETKEYLTKLHAGPAVDGEEKELKKYHKRQVKEAQQIIESGDEVDVKLNALHTKYLLALQESKKLQQVNLTQKRKSEKDKKDINSYQLELAQSKIKINKLEEICRELQKHNREIMSNNKVALMDEQKKRQNLQEKFQTTIEDINTKISEQVDNPLLAEYKKENDELRSKIGHFAEQFDLREKHVEHVIKTKDLEKQLADAKLQQHEEIVKQEKVKNEMCMAKLAQMGAREESTREEYSKKFDEFQSMLTKSNETFGTFKKEMDKCSKLMKANEKEKDLLTKKLQGANGTNIDLARQNKAVMEKLQAVTTQKENMDKLCRGMQSSRSELLFDMNQWKERAFAGGYVEEKEESKVEELKKKVEELEKSVEEDKVAKVEETALAGEGDAAEVAN